VLQSSQGCRAGDWEVKPALAEEKGVLTSVKPLIERLGKKVAGLPDGPPVAL
jgi:hypothetical protein